MTFAVVPLCRKDLIYEASGDHQNAQDWLQSQCGLGAGIDMFFARTPRKIAVNGGPTVTVTVGWVGSAAPVFRFYCQSCPSAHDTGCAPLGGCGIDFGRALYVHRRMTCQGRT
jgi:hypothetical protein